MGYFDDMIDDTLTERELSYNNKKKMTYWKQLTAGQRLSLLKGQSISFTQSQEEVEENGEKKVRALPVTHIELDDNYERNCKLVQMTLCDEKGKPVFPKLSDLQLSPQDLIDELIKIAKEVQKEDAAAEKS